MKKVLITGADSYIGGWVEKWLAGEPENYRVDTLDMRKSDWEEYDFSPYDAVYHVAGIAHADVEKVSAETEKLYYSVNRDLAVKAAQKAREEGVKQFLFMSSMIIYAGCKERVITAGTEPKCLNFYGDSKWQADQRIRELETPDFKVAVLRPPMIYGKGSRGNYPQLARLAGKLWLFPKVKNRRSMLYIENLCRFVKLLIDNEESGVFFPQNSEYTQTSEMVRMIAEVKEHKILMVPGFGWAVRLLMKFPGKIGALASKAFGDMAYDMEMSRYRDEYALTDLYESIRRTEGA